MARISTRLANLERRHKPPPVMRGSYEVHVVGGWPQLTAGQECQEHVRCAFRSTHTHGQIRRMIMFDWRDGMGNPFE